MTPRLAAFWTGGAAFGFSLFQIFYRWMDKEVSGATVAAAGVLGLLYAWWARCLQETGRGEASSLPGLLVLAGWSFAANGLSALIACRPTCDRYEWFSGVGNILIGALAVGASTWAIRRDPSSVTARAGLISAVLVIAAVMIEALT
jgi:hypothetical protein